VSSKIILKLDNIRKSFQMGKASLEVLKGIDLEVTEGDFIAIIGTSGSGKSTLLNLMDCLDRPTSGAYLFNGEDISRMTDRNLSDIRCKHIGFVFQSFNLIPQLDVLENIEVPLFYLGWNRKKRRERCRELAESVGLGERLRHSPTELSGGEMQRVAVARALANDPLLILADEPTGNLDTATSNEIMEILLALNRAGRTIIVVTHDPAIAELAKRIITIRDGQIVDESRDSATDNATDNATGKTAGKDAG